MPALLDCLVQLLYLSLSLFVVLVSLLECCLSYLSVNSHECCRAALCVCVCMRERDLPDKSCTRTVDVAGGVRRQQQHSTSIFPCQSSWVPLCCLLHMWCCCLGIRACHQLFRPLSLCKRTYTNPVYFSSVATLYPASSSDCRPSICSWL